MVTARYFPDLGGIQTHVYEVGRRLVRDGIQVTVLTTMPQQAARSLPWEEDVAGMHIVRVQAWPPGRDYYIAPEIHAWITQGTWDLIHCQGCHTFVPPLAMLSARAARLPYLVTFHTGGHSQGWRNRIRDVQWRAQRAVLQQLEHPLIPPAHLSLPTWDDCVQQLQTIYRMAIREEACVS